MGLKLTLMMLFFIQTEALYCIYTFTLIVIISQRSAYILKQKGGS